MTQQPHHEPSRNTRRRKFALLHFTKMHGLGNDFMVIETLSQEFALTSELIQQWADRRTGIGFDQLLVLGPPKTASEDFSYEIYNADGSKVGQCGNGARALARFIKDQKLSPKVENRLATSHTSLSVQVLESGLSQVELASPTFAIASIPCNPTGQDVRWVQQCARIQGPLTAGIPIYTLSLGNPHAIIFVDDLTTINHTFAEHLQNSALFPESVNVGFAKLENSDNLQLRVVERGAGETMACGSGATAAVIACIEAGLTTCTTLCVSLRGGDLQITWDRPKLQMVGPASRVFTGRILVRISS